MWDTSKIAITSEMVLLIGEIDEFKGLWKLLGNVDPEKLKALRQVATIESVGSSTRIEGAKLSDREVEKLLANLKIYKFASRDQQEVAGYAYVCEEVFQNFANMSFSENLIKQLHQWLLKYSSKDQRHRGDYKKVANHVEAFDDKGKSLGVIFKTATPFETPLKMQELVLWTNEQIEHKILHPLIITGIFIVAFLAIHPFQDGNGRLSRILTTLLLLKFGYHYVPYSSLESIIENSKDAYYLALRKTQRNLENKLPNFTPWLIFFLRALQKQKNHLEQKILRERTLALNLPILSGEIISLIREHGRLTISEIESMTKANRNTLKKHLAKLVNNGNILRHGKSKATWYTLT